MFLSGVFFTIAMTGLDQDMMQKICCKISKSTKNMYYYGFAFIPINLIFLSLGALLLILAQQYNIVLPTHSDEILQHLFRKDFWANGLCSFCHRHYFCNFFSADSALVS